MFKLQNIIEEFLSFKLENDENVKIALISDNTYWANFCNEVCKDFENCQINAFKNLIPFEKNNTNYYFEDFDFIIFFNKKSYDVNIFNKLKEVARLISCNNNKRVSIGYSYIIPYEKRKYRDIPGQIKIATLKNDNEYEECILAQTPLDPTELLEMTVMIHDDLEKQNVKIL